MWRLDARTQTIVCWTGVSRYRIRTLHPRFAQKNFEEYRRRRGVPPYQLASFFRSPAAKQETVTLAGLFRQVELVPPKPSSIGLILPNLHHAQALCIAYEIFQSLVPDSALTIDHAALLAIALTVGEEIRLVRCPDCQGAMVADLLSLQTYPCVYCDEDAAEESGRDHHTVLQPRLPKALNNGEDR